MTYKNLTPLFKEINTGDPDFSEILERLRTVCEINLNRAIKSGFKPSPDILPRHISMVGGIWETRTNLSSCDTKHLITAFSHFLNAGFLINPEFEVDVVNFEYGRDFLMDAHETDFVIFSFLFDQPVRVQPDLSSEEWAKRIERWKLELERMKNYNAQILNGILKERNLSDYGSTLTSPYADIETAWYDRIKLADAKAVMSYFGGLSIHRFFGDGYNTTIHEYSGGIDSELKGWDYAFSDDYLVNMHPFLNKQHPLFSRIDKKVLHDNCFDFTRRPIVGF